MADAGRLGKKANAGFYAYDDAGKRLGLWDGLAKAYPVAEKQPDLTEVQHRLLFAQVLEAVRALEDGVLMDIREGDVGAILGWGFAPWSGGPLSWLDMISRRPRGRNLRWAGENPRPAFRSPRPAARYGDRRARRSTPALPRKAKRPESMASSCSAQGDANPFGHKNRHQSAGLLV